MSSPTEATLHGGPAGGRKLAVSGYPAGHWPEYVCVNMGAPKALSAHYRHIAVGVYEHQGACVEFDHHPGYHIPRCADCGSQVLGHPTEGHRQ